MDTTTQPTIPPLASPDAALPPVKIRGEFTPDPNVCRFVVNRPVMDEEGWTLVCRTAEDAKGSPILEAVFEEGGIGQVSINGSVLVVVKATEDGWPKVASKLIPKLKKVVAAGGVLVSPEAIQAMKESYNSDNLFEQIEELFEKSVNPALASHGGWVKLLEIKDRDVFIQLGGGCQGCASSQQTLKFGIEQAIRDLCPQVREIVDNTDHAAGTNPYYK